MTSADHSVSVHASTGQAEQGTQVQITTGGDGAPPPPLFRPLTRPFDIKVTAGRLRAGTVTVRIPEGTALSQPGNVVMLIQHGSSGWQLLRTTVNIGAGTATARWPHFSKGWLGIFDPLFSPVAAGAQWSWQKVKAGASWVGDEAAALGKFVGGGALALLGGTMRSVKCTPDSKDWAFAGTNADGGHMTFPPLDGCAEPADSKTGSWRVHVGNKYPYPYLLDLPAGTAPPYFSDMPASTDLPDWLLSYVWGMHDHVVIPGGGNSIIRLGPTSASHVEMSAVTDPSTLAVKVLSLVALFYSAGDTAAMKAEVASEKEALDQAFIASRERGDTTMTLSDYIYETGWDSPIARKQRKLATTTTAAAADQVFNDVDLLNCAIGVRAKYRATNGGVAAAVEAVLDQMLDKCWPNWAKATVLNTAAGVTASQSPDARAAESAHLIKGLIEQAKDIPRLALGSDSAFLKLISHNRFDYTKVALQASRAGVTHLSDALPAPGEFGFNTTDGTDSRGMLTAEREDYLPPPDCNAQSDETWASAPQVAAGGYLLGSPGGPALAHDVIVSLVPIGNNGPQAVQYLESLKAHCALPNSRYGPVTSDLVRTANFGDATRVYHVMSLDGGTDKLEFMAVSGGYYLYVEAWPITGGADSDGFAVDVVTHIAQALTKIDETVGTHFQPSRGSTPGSAWSNPAQPAASIQSLVGSWSGHSRGATISANGLVNLGWRTYTICGSADAKPGHACEPADNPISEGGHATMHLEQQSGGLVAQVLSSNDTDFAGDLPVKVLLRDAQGRPTAISIGQSASAMTLCTTDAPQMYCGA